jgi:soluble lytic murein transglycosylase-like protein
VAGQSIRSYVDDSGVRVFTNHGSRIASSQSYVRPRQASASELKILTQRGQAYRPLVKKISNRHGVDFKLVEAIIATESNFDPKAVSVKNCKGLMQLHPDTARRFGVRNVFDPEENIGGGVQYLSWLIDHFQQDLEKAVAAYNAGEGAVNRYRGVPPYKETRAYVQKVSRLYDLMANSRPTPVTGPIRRVETDDGRVLFTNIPADL